MPFTPEERRQRANESSRRSKDKHREEVNAARRAYHVIHREEENAKGREYRSEWRAKDPEGFREYVNRKAQEKRDRNPEKSREINNRHRLNHLEESRAKDRARHRGNPDHIASAVHWKRTHREQARENGRRSTAKRRSLARQLPATFTDADWRIALDYFDGRCAYCGNGPSLFDVNWVLHQEHHIPQMPAYELTEPNPGFVATNIVPACQDCNFKKSSRNPVEWALERFGKREGRMVLARIQAYFDHLTPSP